jgi:exoribonuclease II
MAMKSLLEVQMNYDIDRTKQVNHFFESFLINEINFNYLFWKIKRFISYGDLYFTTLSKIALILSKFTWQCQTKQYTSIEFDIDVVIYPNKSGCNEL